MVPWGTGDPISSGDLNTLVFLTEKPPSLSVSIGGGSMSLFDRCDISDLIRCLNTRITDFKVKRAETPSLQYRFQKIHGLSFLSFHSYYICCLLCDGLSYS